MTRKRTPSAKGAVMRPKYRMRVARDQTKYTRKTKHKEKEEK